MSRSTRRCYDCGNRWNDGPKFCPECGNKGHLFDPNEVTPEAKLKDAEARIKELEGQRSNLMVGLADAHDRIAELEARVEMLTKEADGLDRMVKAADELAIELSARCSCPCQMPEDERCEACRLVTAYWEAGK